MSTMLSDGVIVRPWSKYKGHHHIKDLWTLANSVMDKLRVPPHNIAFSQKSEVNSSLKMEER